MFTFLYDKFTQDNMYQISSQSVRFRRLYIKKTFWCVFSVHSVVYHEILRVSVRNRNSDVCVEYAGMFTFKNHLRNVTPQKLQHLPTMIIDVGCFMFIIVYQEILRVSVMNRNSAVCVEDAEISAPKNHTSSRVQQHGSES